MGIGTNGVGSHTAGSEGPGWIVFWNLLALNFLALLAILPVAFTSTEPIALGTLAVDAAVGMLLTGIAIFCGLSLGRRVGHGEPHLRAWLTGGPGTVRWSQASLSQALGWG